MPKHSKPVEMGDIVKDVVTGFTGVAESRHEYLNGCVRWGVSSTKLDKEGKPGEPHLFDAQQLIPTGKNVMAKLPKPAHVKPPGGPRSAPARVEMPQVYNMPSRR